MKKLIQASPLLFAAAGSVFLVLARDSDRDTEILSVLGWVALVLMAGILVCIWFSEVGSEQKSAPSLTLLALTLALLWLPANSLHWAYGWLFALPCLGFVGWSLWRVRALWTRTRLSWIGWSLALVLLPVALTVIHIENCNQAHARLSDIESMLIEAGIAHSHTPDPTPSRLPAMWKTVSSLHDAADDTAELMILVSWSSTVVTAIVLLSARVLRRYGSRRGVSAPASSPASTAV